MHRMETRGREESHCPATTCKRKINFLFSFFVVPTGQKKAGIKNTEKRIILRLVFVLFIYQILVPFTILLF